MPGIKSFAGPSTEYQVAENTEPETFKMNGKLY